MKRVVIIAISAISITAMGKEPGKPEKLIDVKIAKNVVLNDLKDPESARFRNLYISNSLNNKGELIQHLCGEINAKNAMGGYVGYRRFFTDNEISMIDPAVDPGSETAEAVMKTVFDNIYPHVCSNRTREGHLEKPRLAHPW